MGLEVLLWSAGSLAVTPSAATEMYDRVMRLGSVNESLFRARVWLAPGRYVALSAARSITLAVVATLLMAGSASASLFLIFAPEGGPPGIEVTGRTGGEGAFASAVVGPFQTYLVDQAEADGVTSPNDPALFDIGQLVVDAGGNGSIRFVVPDVAPATYAVMIHCPPCAEFSGGRVMLEVASFEVTPKAPDSAILDRFPLPAALTAFGGLLLVIAILIATNRQRTSA